MLQPEAFLSALRSSEIEFFAGVPDSLLKELLQLLDSEIEPGRHVICPNEGTAIGLAAGHYLASNKLPLVYLQNSGLGNAINPLMSLTHSKVYGIPLLLLIGWRGQPQLHDEPQHQAMGEATLPILETLNIPYEIIDATRADFPALISKICAQALASCSPVALVCSKDTFAPASLPKRQSSDPDQLSREEALAAVVQTLRGGEAIVSTTGMASRELYELREAAGQPHSCDLLNPGAMGHASQLALGIALGEPDRRVICLDGDGALIMHMGSLVTIGRLSPDNLLHIVLNNGAHDSVGGQPTGAKQIDIPAIAMACGYQAASRCASAFELQKELTAALRQPGPRLIEVMIRTGARSNLARPDSAFHKQKNSFMQFLQTSWEDSIVPGASN